MCLSKTVMRSFFFCTLYQILLRSSSKRGMNRSGHERNQQCVQNFRRKTAGKVRLHRRRRRLLDNIKVDFNERRFQC
jgi:hypothetical protein